MHAQTAAWLEDLDFTDNDEDLPIDPAGESEAKAEAQTVETFTTSHALGHSLANLPAEVLLCVIDWLDLPGLACFMQTCKDIRATCMIDVVWERLCEGSLPKANAQSRKYHQLRLGAQTAIAALAKPSNNASASAPGAHTAELPAAASQADFPTGSKSQRHAFFDGNLRLRYGGDLVIEPAWLSLMPKVSCQGAGWLYVKGKTLSDSTLKGCAPAFWHTHHHVRSKLHSLWLMGEVDDNLLLQRTLLKLTRLSWSKTYETLSSTFVYVSDCIAMDVKTDYVEGDVLSAATEAKPQSLWQAVLQFWQDYRVWLTRVCSLCTRLVECISAERAAEMMSRGKADTPTLFDMGKAAFRSQVVLAFGLRTAMQSSWQALRSSAKSNQQSVEDAHVLLDVTRLLQELDVVDDGTKPAGYHTQERMREVFGLGEYRHEHARTLLNLQLCNRRGHALQ